MLTSLGLNVNHGQSIFVRLRQPSNPDSFLPFEQCLDTLLHELVHNVQGPHDERFHRIWNELRDEWMELQIKGYTGDGFLSRGNQLGGNHIPRDELRRMARSQARQEHERYKKYGNKLGGSSQSVRVRDAAATAAIKRNEITDNGCATGTKAAAQAMEDALLNGFRSQAEMDEANDLAIQMATFQLMEMEEAAKLQHGSARPVTASSSSTPAPSSSEGLTWDPQNGLQMALSGIPHEQWETPISPSRPDSAPPVPYDTRPDVDAYGRPLSRLVMEAEAKKSRKQQVRPDSTREDRQPGSARPANPWACVSCTLINHAGAMECEACGKKKPKGVSVSQGSSSAAQPVAKPSGWVCSACGTWSENKWWTCSYCGSFKTSS